jgi:aldehyde dehydrogenase (NAD+)
MPKTAVSLRLQPMRSYYNCGATGAYAFRIEQLCLLKSAVLKYEQEISNALYVDLKKSKEESFAAETGLILKEISIAIKNLRSWMKPVRVKTNLLNFPSSSWILPHPKGVVLIISPWNYPFLLSFSPIVGAIAAGNCIVLKPSELAAASSTLMAKIIKETFAPDYIRVYEGEGKDIVPALMEQFHFDHIFYTGSTQVGKIINQLAAKELIPVTLELGGKSPAVVEADADIKSTARRIALGKFLNAGQTCVAPDYLLVHNSVLDEFLGELKKVLRLFFGEDPKQSHDYGKIINENRFDQLISYFSDGKQVVGGTYDRSRLFIAPTILKNVSPNSRVMQEEIFGPILPVFGFDDAEQAFSLIYQHKNPLAFYVFSSSRERQNFWTSKIAFGGGCINNSIWHLSNPWLPFGGTGDSGIGGYHGKHSFDIFTHGKSIMKTPVWFDPNIKYPPYKGKLKWLRFLIK